ncbi:MAG: DUF6163 family protein [Rhizobiaceae bacterium]|nr:DUF6163 family protein [Rhizobiaceae bacterium]MCV0405313.1 DUF6163 family protein [Rhizobiaceae bacterium]
MTDHASEGSRVLLPSAAEVAFEWFHRLVALYCLVLGLAYWLRLVGFYEGPLYRFDLMPVHWQVASVSLAVLYPFAASGLWMIASWGPVIWFLCAAAETVMHAGFPELFGAQPELLAGHAGIALVYAGFRLVIYLQKRRRA